MVSLVARVCRLVKRPSSPRMHGASGSGVTQKDKKNCNLHRIRLAMIIVTIYNQLQHTGAQDFRLANPTEQYGNEESCTTPECSVQRSNTGLTIKQYHEELIRRAILEKLGLPNGPPVLPTPIYECLKGPNAVACIAQINQTAHETTTAVGKPASDTVTVKASVGSPPIGGSSSSMLMFHLPERSARAKLFILVKYERESQERKNPNQRVNLLIQSYDLDSQTMSKVGDLNVMVRHTKWHKFILPTSLIVDTMLKENRSLLLKVSCSNCSPNGPRPVLLFRSDSNNPGTPQVRRDVRPGDAGRRRRNRNRGARSLNRINKRRPYLMVRVVPQRTPRSLRKFMRTSDMGTCDDSNLRVTSLGRCAVNTMTLNFAEMGMDFIIQPRVIPFFRYCAGGCEDESETRSRHSHGRCCRASTSSSIEVVYVDHGGQTKSAAIDNVMADACQCL